MREKSIRTLKIDMQFKNLIRPLLRKEYLQLEENILADGCRDPIITWNEYIVDGHNRYEICTRHSIPFYVQEIEFTCREAAISWICANQLGRRNITEETRKFLIGKQYESEKIMTKNKNPNGVNQHGENGGVSTGTPIVRPDKLGPDSRHITAGRIARENNISHGTVEKYAIYSKAVDTITEKEPGIVPKILSGTYKISHKNLVELSRLPPDEIRKVGRRIEKMQQPYVQYKRTRREIQNSSDPELGSPSVPSVKDMPAFDPDAEITGLTLTIPSWASSIERAMTKSDLSIVSLKARKKLVEALFMLASRVDEMISEIGDD